MAKAEGRCEQPTQVYLKLKDLIHLADGPSPIQARRPKLQ